MKFDPTNEWQKRQSQILQREKQFFEQTNKIELNLLEKKEWYTEYDTCEHITNHPSTHALLDYHHHYYYGQFSMITTNKKKTRNRQTGNVSFFSFILSNQNNDKLNTGYRK